LTSAPERAAFCADGTKQRRLTQTSAGALIDPRWSPDGRRIVFVHAPHGRQPGGPKVIYVMNADGANAQRLSRWWLSFETLKFLFVPPFRAEESLER